MAAREDDEQGTSLTSLCLIFSPMLSISPTFPLKAPPAEKGRKIVGKGNRGKKEMGKAFSDVFF